MIDGRLNKQLGESLVGFVLTSCCDITGVLLVSAILRMPPDLSEQARILAEGELLVPRPSVQPPQKTKKKAQQRQKKSGSEPKIKWSKGFLSGGASKPAPEHFPRKGDKEFSRVEKGASDESPSPPIPPTEIKYNDSDGHEHVVEVEGGEDAPIMEIREWLDESGEQTSVDVTDLGKVLGTTQKALKTGSLSAANNAGNARGSSSSSLKGAVAASHAYSNAVDRKESSDLDSVLTRLEEQEANAEKEAASPALGRNWKKGFLDTGAKLSTQEPRAATPSAQERRRSTGTGSVLPKPSNESAASTPHAFRGTVVEKTNGGASSSLNSRACIDAAPARVSRFKARRQGL